MTIGLKLPFGWTRWEPLPRKVNFMPCRLLSKAEQKLFCNPPTRRWTRTCPSHWNWLLFQFLSKVRPIISPSPEFRGAPVPVTLLV